MSSNKMQENLKKRELRIFRYKEQEIVTEKSKTKKSKNELCCILQHMSVLKACVWKWT